MLYLIIGTDGDDAGRLRAELLEAHLEWVLTAMERLRVAGPVKDERGRACTSLYIVEADGEAAARALVEQDPYYRGGVWRELSVRPFVAAAGTWVGGASWLRG